MIRKIASILFLISSFISPCIVNAADDKPTVKASFSRDTILIGDQFTLDVIVEKDITQVVSFPEFKESIFGDSLEILGMLPIDTLKVDGRKQTIKLSYLMTGFDEGVYRLGQFPVFYLDKNISDTLVSEDLMDIVVKTFVIDTTKQSIADITPQIDTPLNWAELKSYIFNKNTSIAFIILVLIVVVIYCIIKKRRRGSIFAPKAQEPPHVIAIRELEKLQSQKLWQNSKHKLYYTSLTDILRVYIEGRYGINAMEMTSEEILKECKNFSLTSNDMDRLSGVLQLADLVKFAKFVPDNSENETQYFNAYYFVEETKLMPHESDKVEEVEI